jgi:hypothetical protein
MVMDDSAAVVLGADEQADRTVIIEAINPKARQ